MSEINAKRFPLSHQQIKDRRQSVILLHKGAFYLLLLDRSELDLADYVVSLAEKSKPIPKHTLLLLR